MHMYTMHMAAQVISIVRRWLDDASTFPRTKAAAQLTSVLAQSPSLVGLALRIEGGPAALVVGVSNLDATSGPLQDSRAILHAVADVICGKEPVGAQSSALRAANPGRMLVKHIGRLQPLSDPDPDRLQRMNSSQRLKAVLRAVHISKMAMLLHHLVSKPWELKEMPGTLSVVTSAVPWMTAVAHHCIENYGTINSVVSGPATLLLLLTAAPDLAARPKLPQLLQLLPHMVSTLRMGCSDTLLSSGTGGNSDIRPDAAAELLSALHAPLFLDMEAHQLSSFLLLCDAFPILSAYLIRFDGHGRLSDERDAVVIAALDVVQSLLEEATTDQVIRLLGTMEPRLVDRISSAMFPPPPHRRTMAVDSPTDSANSERGTGALDSRNVGDSGGNDNAHVRIQACSKALYTISQHWPDAVANSCAMAELLKVTVALPARMSCSTCIDAAWYASGCYTAVVQQCALTHCAEEALQKGMLQSVVAAVEAGAAAPGTPIAHHLEHWILCINFFLDFVPKEGGRQAVAAGARTVLVRLLSDPDVFKAATMVLLRMAEETSGHKAVLFAPGLVAALLDVMEAAVAWTYQEHMKGKQCTIQQATADGMISRRDNSYRDPFPNIDPFSAIVILLCQAVDAGAVKSGEFVRAEKIINTAISVGPGQRSHAALNSIIQAAREGGHRQR